MTNFKEALKNVAIANEFLLDNKLERAYITLYDSRSHLLENYEESSHEDMMKYLNSQGAPINEPFVIIDRTGLEFDESIILTLSEFDNHHDLLDHVDADYKHLKEVI